MFLFCWTKQNKKDLDKKIKVNFLEFSVNHKWKKLSNINGNYIKLPFERLMQTRFLSDNPPDPQLRLTNAIKQNTRAHTHTKMFESF